MEGNLLGINAMPNTTKISSKTDALTYAIAVTRTADGLHLDMADRVFRMFIDNIELPDTAEEIKNNFLTQATETLKAVTEQVNKLPANDIQEEHNKETATETTTEVAVEVKKEE